MDPQNRISFAWKINGDMIDFEIAAKTNDWVGIGFSPNGAMTGADMVVGWIDQANTAHVSVIEFYSAKKTSLNQFFNFN